MPSLVNRRNLLRGSGAVAAGLCGNAVLPQWALTAESSTTLAPPALSGNEIALTIGHVPLKVDGRAGHAIGINGTVPGPLIRLREGQRVRIAVTNTLREETSIHWHGILIPFQMDGVPGVSFPGIAPGQTFVYDFPVIQSGTYWYHSHSGLQEQEGHYGPIIIDPQGNDTIQADREYVVVLSDFTFQHPHLIFQRMKQEGGVFNYQKQTLAGLLRGEDQTLAERLDWAKMRMDPTDISDVTGAAYKFLVNGHGPEDNWTAIFRTGERVRLRFINAGAQTIFNVRIPGLSLKVVSADGQNVRPVDVEEFQIGNAETYDIVVHPSENKAFTIVAEAVDRSGMARATLAPQLGMTSSVPPLRERPRTTMKDMGMDMNMGSMDMGSMKMDMSAPQMDGQNGSGTMEMSAMSQSGVDHSKMDHTAMDSGAMKMEATSKKALPGFAPPKPRGSDVMGDMSSMSGMDMSMRSQRNAPQVKMGPGVQTISPMPQDRTGEPGQGLESVGHRVLVYKDLQSLDPNPDRRIPTRALEIRLTGNMERFMWGFDGFKFSENPVPYTFERHERARITLVNDTMMTHPIHLHGHFFELVHGTSGHHPRKHTVNVLPGGKVTFDITAEPGDWAFHCHMLYHMHAGMFQIFSVRPIEGEAA